MITKLSTLFFVTVGFVLMYLFFYLGVIMFRLSRLIIHGMAWLTCSSPEAVLNIKDAPK